MAPRKRQRPNPAGASSSGLPLPSATPGTTSPSPAPPVLDTTTRAVGELPKQKAEDNNTAQQTVHKTRSWYGSWPRAPKASASTPQLARESILGGTQRPSTNSTPELQRFDTRRHQSSDVSSIEPSLDPAASLPNIPEAVATLEEPDQTGQPEEEGKTESPTAAGETIPVAIEAGNTSSTTGVEPSTPPRPTTSSGWLSWLGKSPLPGAPLTGVESLPVEPKAIEAQQEPIPEPPQPVAPAAPVTGPEELTAPAPQPPTTPKAEAQPPPASSSWLPFWTSTPKPEASTTSLPVQSEVTTAVMPTDKEPEDTPMPDAPTTPTQPAPKSPPPSAGSTWAFWSRDVRPSTANKPSGQKPQEEAGELAVIGQGSEAHPQPAQGIEIETPEAAKEPDVKPAKPAKEPKAKLGLAAAIAGKKNSKRMRPQSMDLDESPVPSGVATPQPVASSKSSIAESTQETPSKASTSKQATAPGTPTKTLPPNLLLPSFGSTYHMKDNPSILKQIAQLLLRTQQPPPNHVFRAKETPTIKKAIAIGVHGLFPASYLRPIIGQPTGTSLRFANHCAEGIRRWADTHGCPDCEIEKVALEGEGKIANRVDNLWKLLLNWIEHLRNADLIILACHSQGVPVAVMLVAKLIDLGIITNARIGVCAMAGVSLGPFPDYKSSMGMLMGTGAELWEFSNPDSEVSKRYEVALKEVLEYGARITFVGSIDDQLVPMESAVYSPASHPYIYRAVFIDGRVHAPDFIAHLVGFALKLRNLGVSDHGLIRELSTPLAGSLYSGEGHSRLYYDDQVYDLAVAHALETTDIPPSASNRCCHINHPHRPVAATTPAPGGQQAAGTTSGTGSVKGSTAAAAPLANPNPYHLPWIMRGLLEENFVKTELSAETEELLKQFDDWKPTTKALKDVKYRLEAVRSRL